MRLKPLLLMQPYSVTHLRQNLTSQPQASSQPPDTPLTTGHGPTDVRLNKPMSDIKGKRREADSASSRTQLEAIPEDIGMNEEHGLGPSSLTRSSHPGTLTPSTNMPLSSGASNSTTDIYRRPEPLSQSPYNYHYSTPSTSPSKPTLIPPKIIVNSPSSGSTQHHIAAGSTHKSLGSTVLQNFPTTPTQSHPLPQASTTLSLQRRRSRDHPASTTHNTPIRRSNHGIAPLTSDARTEHVLLAARRIGRERAGLVAGIKQHAEREMEIHSRELELVKARQDLERSEKERLERLANGTSGLAYYRSSTDVLTSSQQRNTGRGSASATVPRTPKRGGGVGAIHYPGLSGALSSSPISTPTRVPTSAGPSTFVFVNTSAGAGTSGYSGGGVMSTPGQPGSVLKSSGTARGGSRTLPSNPPTPLDSLLDAARSMMDDGGAGGKAGGKTNGTRKALEHSENPVPKRRRVSSSGSKTVGRGGGVGGASIGSKATRVRSALDVLADQAAAAFDEPGQTSRGSTIGGKGKEKMKVGDEDLSNSADDEADNVQEGDGVGRQDNSWPRGPASASSMGPNRGRSRAKIASITTRPTAEPTSTSSMSLRPIRQASQKRLASQDLQQQPSTSTTRGKGKSRGRPKGSKSRPRSAVSAKSWSMNPSLGPRVIASAPMSSPLDKAIALQSQKDRSRETGKERERREEHSQRTMVNLDRSPGLDSPRLGLRPVVEWGERGTEDEGDEDVEGEGEYVSVGVRELELAQQDDYVEGGPDVDGDGEITAGNDKVTAVSTPNDESVSTLKVMAQDMEEDETQTIDTANGHVSLANLDLMTTPPIDDTDADADAELDDEDAEGDQDDDDDDEPGQDRSSRSRTPPPPDPPHFGAPSDSNDDDPDADADAEGEMDFEENEELPSRSTSSAMHQTALNVPRSQVPPVSFDGFLLEVIWLIMVFWMKSNRSVRYSTTSSHVLISATVPETLPSSLSILSDLSDKISLQLAYLEQERKFVVGSRGVWWRGIDVQRRRGLFHCFSCLYILYLCIMQESSPTHHAPFRNFESQGCLLSMGLYVALVV